MSEFQPQGNVQQMGPLATVEQLDGLVQGVCEQIWHADLPADREVRAEIEDDDGTTHEVEVPVYRFALNSLALLRSPIFRGWEEGTCEFCGPTYLPSDGEEVVPATLCFNLVAEDITAEEYIKREMDIYIACSQDEHLDGEAYCYSQVSLSCYSDVRRQIPILQRGELGSEDDDRLRLDEVNALREIVDSSL